MDSKPEHLITVDDFLNCEAFRTFLREKQPEDRLFWQTFLEKYPERRDTYEQAVIIYLAIQGKQPYLPSTVINNKVRKIEESFANPKPAIIHLNSTKWLGWMAAACLTIFVFYWQTAPKTVGNLVARLSSQSKKPVEPRWKEVKNIETVAMVVLLPENSSVLLSPNSKIRFQTGTTNQLREVYLQGEGFFEVAKNPKRPFIVYTNRLTTRVLGTSFRVRAFEKEPKTLVEVKTGKVTVTSTQHPEKSIQLTVNDRFSIEKNQEKLVKHLTVPSNQQSANIVTQDFTFDFVPIPDIFSVLQETYHMPIVYDRKLLQNCTFTGQLNDVPFIEKIRLICLTIESTYEVVNNQVIIHSQGCH